MADPGNTRLEVTPPETIKGIPASSASYASIARTNGVAGFVISFESELERRLCERGESRRRERKKRRREEERRKDAYSDSRNTDMAGMEQRKQSIP